MISFVLTGEHTQIVQAISLHTLNTKDMVIAFQVYQVWNGLSCVPDVFDILKSNWCFFWDLIGFPLARLSSCYWNSRPFALIWICGRGLKNTSNGFCWIPTISPNSEAGSMNSSLLWRIPTTVSGVYWGHKVEWCWMWSSCYLKVLKCCWARGSMSPSIVPFVLRQTQKSAPVNPRKDTILSDRAKIKESSFEKK